MSEEKKDTFEKEMSALEKSAERIRAEETTLEDAIKLYEEGIAHYEKCSEILQNAKQKIETYSK